MNQNFTAEEVRALLLKIEGGPISVEQRVELFDIASRHADSIERAQAGVTEEVVMTVWAHAARASQYHNHYSIDRKDDLRAALLAVWPIVPATNSPETDSKLVGGSGSDESAVPTLVQHRVRYFPNKDWQIWMDGRPAPICGYDRAQGRCEVEVRQLFTHPPAQADSSKLDHASARAVALLCRALVSDDAFAITHQSQGQYRSALIAKLDGLIAECKPSAEPVTRDASDSGRVRDERAAFEDWVRSWIVQKSDQDEALKRDKWGQYLSEEISLRQIGWDGRAELAAQGQPHAMPDWWDMVRLIGDISIDRPSHISAHKEEIWRHGVKAALTRAQAEIECAIVGAAQPGESHE